MKNKMKIEIGAARQLVAAIIAQGINDYKAMEARGWVMNGKVLLPKKLARARKTKKTLGIVGQRAVCEEMVMFFQPGGMMDRWVEMAALDICPSRIRSELGFENLPSAT